MKYFYVTRKKIEILSHDWNIGDWVNYNCQLRFFFFFIFFFLIVINNFFFFTLRFMWFWGWIFMSTSLETHALHVVIKYNFFSILENIMIFF